MDIPFESFAKLIHRLGNPPRSTSKNKERAPIPPKKIFQSWLNHLPRPFPDHTVKVLFRLLFPHEGSRRRYGLKEAKLALELERVLGLKGLTRWDAVVWDGGKGGTGCLGREVEIHLNDWTMVEGRSTLSIRELDLLLDELASSSPFSQLSQLPSPVRTTSTILSMIYRQSGLSPYALSVITQIILRDLRPLLSPLPRLPIRNPTTMLRLKSNAGPEQLTLRDAMLCWDREMWALYAGGKGDIDKCADLVEEGDVKRSIKSGPVVGVNVKIPKCRKGRSISDALSEFTGTKYAPPTPEAWAETKYDGYRMQIHVDCTKGVEPIVKVFSKSTRDSTSDRINAHSIILSALSLPVPTHLPSHAALHQRLSALRTPRRQVRSIILEAEVVPYNEASREGSRGKGIEEFWWLGHAGVTSNPIGWDDSTAFPRNRSRHLCLVFFDVLMIDGQSLLDHTYEHRRAVLEQVVRPIEGFAMLAERTRIPMGVNRQTALNALEGAFENSNERREEGLVLKASESTYTNMRWQWVKLKKDYIPNLGDCVDLVLLGAGWDIDRARELRVDTSVFTTFYLGALTNSERVKTRREVPNFEVLFRVSYGLDRAQLEVYNENIRHGRWGSKNYDKDDMFKRRLLGLSWTYTLQKGMVPPSVLFQTPMCAEVMGAGFQRLPGSEMYELRWPRLMKIHDPSNRRWTEALSANELVHQAHLSLGYNTPPSPKSSDDSVKAAWRSSSTLALIDVPQLVSPSGHSLSPRGTKRVRSEPNIHLGRLSPIRSSGGHGIGTRCHDDRDAADHIDVPKDHVGPRASGDAHGPWSEGNQPGGVVETGRRLRDLMSDDEGAVEWVDQMAGPLLKRTRSDPREHEVLDLHDRQPSEDGMGEQLFSPCSPIGAGDDRAQLLSSPCIRLPRRRSASADHRISRVILPAQVTLSPAKKLISSIDWAPVLDHKHEPEPVARDSRKGSKKKAQEMRRRRDGARRKPLSLRSRLKILCAWNGLGLGQREGGRTVKVVS